MRFLKHICYYMVLGHILSILNSFEIKWFFNYDPRYYVIHFDLASFALASCGQISTVLESSPGPNHYIYSTLHVAFCKLQSVIVFPRKIATCEVYVYRIVRVYWEYRALTI